MQKEEHETGSISAAERRVEAEQRRVYGERYTGANLGTLRLSLEDQKKMAKFLDKPKNFLVFCGSPGIGKTHFCASLTAWAIKNFNFWRYWKEADLLKRVRSSMDEYKGDYLDTLKHLIDDELLMIDDIGSTGLTDWREECLFYALDERYNTMRPTVLTSNFTVAEFKRNFHPRICSRLFATENIIIEIADGEDLRQKGM